MNSSANAKEIEMVMINLRICLWFFVSFVSLLIIYYISKKPKTNRKSKEHKELISPILAEVLIDGKIDIKNLILTTIVELQIKKNIAIVNDEVIELIHKENLNLHEIYLVDMIFQDKKVVTFNEINDRFVYARTYESNFLEHMSKITDEIQTKLYKMKLFSRKKMIALNLLSFCCLIILTNLPSLLLNAGFNQYFIYAFLTVLVSVYVILYLVLNIFGKSEILKTNNIIDLFIYKKEIVILLVSIFSIILMFTMLPKVQFNIFSILGIIGIYGVNLIALKFSKNNVLSNNGQYEYKKILELKNYLQDYDFRKTYGRETYIIWDEYFAYAAAFGIKNAVISEIYGRWNKLDMTLWFTENLI